MAPFINNGQATNGPEGEISPEETYELKILFCPTQPGIYSCTLPIVVNNNFDRPYYYIDIRGELLVPEIYFEPECLILRPVPLGMQASDQIFIKQRGYNSKSRLKLQVENAKYLDGSVADVIKADFIG